VGEIVDEMETRVAVARAAGVEDDRIVVDPGFGFAKRSEHSIRLLAELERVTAREWPVAVGVSRKRFIGELSGAATPAERLEGTIAANVMALAAGARIFRVHDVRAHRRALDVAWEITRRRETGTER
jgi:dihydropteroate synthase